MDILHLVNILEALKPIDYSNPALSEISMELNGAISRNDDNEDHIPLIRKIIDYFNSNPDKIAPNIRKSLSVFSTTFPLKPIKV